MTKYREIIRLQSLNFSERNIALSCSVSRNTVSKVLKKADEINISWPLDETMTDDALENILFPKEKSATNKRMPDYAYIRKELLRNGVSKKTLNLGSNALKSSAKVKYEDAIEIATALSEYQAELRNFKSLISNNFCRLL